MPYAFILTARRRIPVLRRGHMRAARKYCDQLARHGPAIIVNLLGRQLYVGKPDRRHYRDPPLPRHEADP